ncbi:MAG: regulatory protein [Subtercola sp.]|nr:regulatory protein [Subtercola sp.]
MTARVTYLPGVVPPSDEVAPPAEQVPAEQAPVVTSAAPQEKAPVAPEALPKALPTVWWAEEEPVAAPAAPTGTTQRRAARAPVFEEEAELDEEPMGEGERAAFLENIVVRALARKGLSEWEVSKLLTTNGVEEHELELFLERYRQNRYIDDYDLAETLVESLHRRKGFGRSQIKAELSARHIQPEIVSAALDDLDDDDELKRATELAEKRAPSLARLDAATAERRLTSFLMRKGYPSAIIRTAVSAALSPQARGVRFR